MMNDGLTRREFAAMSLAALGGVAAGCQSMDKGGGAAGPALLLEEPHVCRGLNTCKGKGQGGANACAGQGACATAVAHSCAGQNACKGQGGCGEIPGQNACKGKGQCAVPLSKEAWTKARAAFEVQAKAKGMQVGAAPAKG
jgi:hypothetical protein